MITNQILERITGDKRDNKEVIRLAYEIANEGLLKGPNASSLGFIQDRMNKLQDIFGRYE